MRRGMLMGLLLALCWGSLTLAGQAKTLAHATFGGGCFWAVQAEFEQLKGVTSALPGYAGGTTVNPTYEQVCSHTTGHAEVVDITYDPKVLSYRELVRVFMGAHDPTTLNRQGPDEGESYRSIILTRTPQEAATVRQVIAEQTKTKVYSRPIVTQVQPLKHFYPAEAYHNHYYAQHPFQPYCAAVVSQEVARFRSRFASQLKK